jgi:diguanylate cyclase (GGDEF)-like protein
MLGFKADGWRCHAIASRLRGLFNVEAAYPSHLAAVQAVAFVLAVGALAAVAPHGGSIRVLLPIGAAAATLFGGGRFGAAATAAAAAMAAFGNEGGIVASAAGVFCVAAASAAASLLAARASEAVNIEHKLLKTDPQTGLFNRPGFNMALEYELRRHFRNGVPLTLVYLDCDNFKAINDAYGYDGGDRMLKAAAEAMLASLRRTDHIARIGGDEFAIILIESDKDDARRVVGQLSRDLHKAVASPWKASFSIGAVSFSRTDMSAEEAMRLTEEALSQVRLRSRPASVFVHEEVPVIDADVLAAAAVEAAADPAGGAPDEGAETA